MNPVFVQGDGGEKRLFVTLFFNLLKKTLHHQLRRRSQYEITSIQVTSGTAALK
jgi:hypothetical protein